MSGAFTGVSATLYRKIVKPLFFRFTTPDQAHHIVMKAMKTGQSIPGIRNMVKFALAYQNPQFLGQRIHGIYFKNPIGLAAGFDKNVEVTPFIESLGFGFIEGGSVTYESYGGNELPWYHRLPKTKSILVHAGMPNQGAPKIIDRIESLNLKIPLNMSIGKTNNEKTTVTEGGIEDFLGTIGLARYCSTVSALTINISCPNVRGGEPFTTPDNLERLLSRIDECELNIPVNLKMPLSSTWEEFECLLDIALAHNVQGVTIANLETNRKLAAPLLKDTIPDNAPGGLSGLPTKERSNRLIAQTFAKCGDRLTITGVGGVLTAKDAYQKIRLGSSLVQVVSGLIFQGPQICAEINKGLVRLLQEDGFTSVSQAVGVDAFAATEQCARDSNSSIH